MVEKFTFSAKLDQSGPGKHVVMAGPWRDVTGTIGAQAKYQLEPLPAGIDLKTEDLPPSGTYPGRMNLGGANVAKKQQIVDRMTLKFWKDGDEVKGDGDGSNRVGRYTMEASCTKTNGSWDVELTRTYTGGPLPRQDSMEKKRKDLIPLAADGPRKPRAAAPPKGAWGAMKKESVVKEVPLKKKDSSIGSPDRPCVAVIFPSTDREAAAKRCPSIADATAFLTGLSLEMDAAIRVPSDQGDGVLFPPAAEAPAKFQRPGLPFSAGHVVLLDVDPATAKSRSWKPTVCAFATASRAAHYCLHVARTCGPRLNSLAWLAFPDTLTPDAQIRMHLRHDGTFTPGLPIHDMATLEKSATG